MRIEKAKEEQMEEILNIYREARQFMREQGNPDQWGEEYPRREMLEQDMKKGELYVCLEEEEIGAVFMFFTGTEPTYEVIREGSWLNDRPYGTLHRIASSGKFRGAGRFCVSWCQEQCRRQGIDMRGDTHRDNLPMQKLLESSGFHSFGTIYVEVGSSRIAYLYCTEEGAVTHAQR